MHKIIAMKLMTAFAMGLHTLASLIKLRSPVFRHRYLFTRQGYIRLRYLCSLAVLLVASFVAIAPELRAHLPEKKLIIADSAGVIDQPDHQDDDVVAAVPLSAIVDTMLADITPKEEVKPLPKHWQETITFNSGDTIGKLLNDKDVGMQDVQGIIKAMSPFIKPQDFKVGQSLVALFDRKDGIPQLTGLTMRLSELKTLNLTRGDGQFHVNTQEIELVEEKRAARVTVSSSIYADMRKQKVPESIIDDMIRAYAWTVDFQRDIWGGEEIELLYTAKVSEDGSIVRGGKLKFANLTLRKKENPIYRHEHKDGRVDFYNEAGRSVKKALLRTPVDGARMSSGYGMRRHPVLGYNKMHKGVDFAAPTGTPIYAAGDGVIEKQYRSRTYGNYIRVRHNKTYKTAYAHLHRFAKGMAEGKRVRQGQVIGYVGSTGRSTGPHLHYEVHKNGKQVNPRSVNLPIGDALKGQELANFKNTVIRLQKQFVRLDPQTPKKLAQSGQ